MNAQYSTSEHSTHSMARTAGHHSTAQHLTLMVKGQLRTELMLRTICSMARGLCNREEPAFLQPCNLALT